MKSNTAIFQLLPPLPLGVSTEVPHETDLPLDKTLEDKEAHRRLRSYASLRLLGLQRDPSALGSNYAREAAFSDKEWAERLWGAPRGKATFIAKAKTPETGEVPARNEEKDRDNEWIGCVTILGPQAIQTISFDLYASLNSARIGQPSRNYLAVVMWVNPNWRKQGVGSMLLSSALQWAKGHVERDGATLEFNVGGRPTLEHSPDVDESRISSYSATRSRAVTNIAVHLQVRADNDTARRLYEGLGFLAINSTSTGDGALPREKLEDLRMVYYC